MNQGIFAKRHNQKLLYPEWQSSKWLKNCKNHVICLDGFMKISAFRTSTFLRQDRLGKWQWVYAISSIGRLILLWVIWKHFAWILIKNN